MPKKAPKATAKLPKTKSEPSAKESESTVPPTPQEVFEFVTASEKLQRALQVNIYFCKLMFTQQLLTYPILLIRNIKSWKKRMKGFESRRNKSRHIRLKSFHI